MLEEVDCPKAERGNHGGNTMSGDKVIFEGLDGSSSALTQCSIGGTNCHFMFRLHGYAVMAEDASL